jgi:hypothetical protein
MKVASFGRASADRGNPEAAKRAEGSPEVVSGHLLLALATGFWPLYTP